VDLLEARARGFEAVTRHPWERARVALTRRLIARHAPIAPGAAIVDIGCGDTFVAETLAREYPHAQFYAVDSAFTDELIATFRGRLTTPNVSLFPSLDDVPLSRPAALVLLMDVVEHIADDRGFLDGLRVRASIGPDTRWLITVPSYDWLFCEHDRFLGHHRRYSIGRLRALLSSVKLTTLESGYWFTSLLAIRTLQVARERLVGAPTGETTDLAAWQGSERAAKSLAAILTLDGGLGLSLSRIGLRLPGLSSFAICRASA
jgi:hypothetical protein